MKPLIVLLIAFAITAVITMLAGHLDFALAGRIAMCAMLLFTAMGHFAFTKGMAMMVPTFIPYKTGVVYLTGVMEIAAAAGLMIPSLVKISAWMLIVFFVLMLPANIFAAQNKIDYQKGDHTGSGLTYLWFRVPLQLAFIVWVYWSTLYCT